LIANNFHFENNCAILSVNGYPQDIAETVLTMLRRNPGLRLFALHDASWEGCRLPLLLRGERWFPDTAVQIVDLGLRPRHVSMMKLITLKGQPQRGEAALPTPLTPEEQSWLEAGNTAEVAALRPARLMRSVYQGFARARQLDSEGGSDASGAGDTGFIWIPYGGADLHAADSFG
jgi:hypothetical protein